jgi:hypothetical protein
LCSVPVRRWTRTPTASGVGKVTGASADVRVTCADLRACEETHFDDLALYRVDNFYARTQ